MYVANSEDSRNLLYQHKKIVWKTLIYRIVANYVKSQ